MVDDLLTIVLCDPQGFVPHLMFQFLDSLIQMLVLTGSVDPLIQMLVLRLLIGDVVPLNQMVLFLVLIGNVVRLTRRFGGNVSS